MTVRELVDAHGSPLWLVDLDRFRANLHEFTALWSAHWPALRIAYSYKTNRLLALAQAAERGGASAEVASEADYELATMAVATDPASVVVDGPAKPDSLLGRAGADGALLLVDSAAELERAANAGAWRIGLRVAQPSFTGAQTRFGIPPGEIVAAAEAACARGLSVRALSTHLVSTDFEPRTGRVLVSWPRPAAEHVSAAALLAELAAELEAVSGPIEEIDLGGGFPPSAQSTEHARGVAGALRERGFRGGLLLEPGRAIVADAVDLAFSVVSVKRLADGSRCLVCDAGTNFLPGAIWSPPRVEAPGLRGSAWPALVTGPLCLNVDVLHPNARLPDLTPGAILVAREVGAYQQSASTQFGERTPAVVVRREGRWLPYLSHERPDESEYQRHAA